MNARNICFFVAVGFLTVPLTMLSVSRAADDAKTASDSVARQPDEVDRAIQEFAERVDLQVEMRDIRIAIRQADEHVKAAQTEVQRAQQNLQAAEKARTEVREQGHRQIQKIQIEFERRQPAKPSSRGSLSVGARANVNDDLLAIIRVLQTEVAALKAEVAKLKSTNEPAKGLPDRN